MTYYIGIDGGGTKTKFTLAKEDGTILNSNIQETIHYMQCGFTGLKERLNLGIEACLASENIERKAIKHIFVGCPGYGDIIKDSAKIESVIKEALDSIEFSIGNDTDNALAGALAGDSGICVIAGTGSIGLGIDPSGARFTSGGWHHAFGGDEGSAHWLACKYLQCYTKQSDGRLEKTELYHTLKAKHKLDDDSDMLDFVINELEFDRTKIASLAADLYPLAQHQDPHALLMYEEAGQELAEIVKAIQRNLSFSQGVKVSYAGGVFKSGSYILTPFEKALKDGGCKLIAPQFEPDIGSVILALQNDGIIISSDVIQLIENTLKS